MTRNDQIVGHRLWTALSGLREQLREGTWPDDEGLRRAIERIAWLCDHIESRREPDAIPLGTLDQAASFIQQMQQDLETVEDLPPEAKAQRLQDAIDSTLTAVAAWPQPNATRISQSLRDGTDQYQKMMLDAAEELKRDLVTAQQQAQEWQADWKESSEKQVAEMAAENLRLKQTVQEVSQELVDQKARLDSALNENAAAFQAAEKARLTAETEASDERKKAFHGQIAAQEKEAASELALLKERVSDADQLLATINQKASASAYGTYADKQQRAAFWWSVVVVSSLAAAVGLVMWTVLEAGDSWHATTSRYAVALVVVGIASYAARQSSRHRGQERKARQRELAIGTLAGFLAKVDSEEVKTLRLAIAADLFVDSEVSDRDGYEPPLTQVIKEVLRRVSRSKSEVVSGPTVKGS